MPHEPAQPAQPAPASPTPRPGPRAPTKPGLMRSLGAFVGHIVHAVKTDPANPPAQRHVISESTHEETREAPDGKVILRRTTVEEVEIQRQPPPS